MKLLKDIDRFSDMWLSNPAAKLEFANLIRRTMRLGVEGRTATYLEVWGWVIEERATAKRLGIDA